MHTCVVYSGYLLIAFYIAAPDCRKYVAFKRYDAFLSVSVLI